jgi:hypothetical protein
MKKLKATEVGRWFFGYCLIVTLGMRQGVVALTYPVPEHLESQLRPDRCAPLWSGLDAACAEVVGE